MQLLGTWSRLHLKTIIQHNAGTTSVLKHSCLQFEPNILHNIIYKCMSRLECLRDVVTEWFLKYRQSTSTHAYNYTVRGSDCISGKNKTILWIYNFTHSILKITMSCSRIKTFIYNPWLLVYKSLDWCHGSAHHKMSQFIGLIKKLRKYAHSAALEIPSLIQFFFQHLWA